MGEDRDLRDVLAEALLAAIADDEEAIAVALARLAVADGEAAIESDDPPDPEDVGCDDYHGEVLVVTQSHRLVCWGQVAAEWTREAAGSWDADGWSVDQGASDEHPSGALLAALRAVDRDHPQVDRAMRGLPAVPEPDDRHPEPDPSGPYCLWWDTVGDDAGPLAGARYGSLRDARYAADAADHRLRERHSGQLLCGYGVGELVDGEWQRVAVDDA